MLSKVFNLMLLVSIFFFAVIFPGPSVSALICLDESMWCNGNRVYSCVGNIGGSPAQTLCAPGSCVESGGVAECTY